MDAETNALKNNSISTTTTVVAHTDCARTGYLSILPSIVVQSFIGQIALNFMDKILWNVEKCVEWSLPIEEVTESIEGITGSTEGTIGDQNGKHVRPMPWVFFLPSLAILSMLRMTINISRFIIFSPRISSRDMVTFVQMTRRNLKSLKNSNSKKRHHSEDKRASINEAKKALIKSIRLTLSSLSCLDVSKPSHSPPPTRIHVSSVFDPDPASTTSTENTSIEKTMAGLCDCGSENDSFVYDINNDIHNDVDDDDIITEVFLTEEEYKKFEEEWVDDEKSSKTPSNRGASTSNAKDDGHYIEADYKVKQLLKDEQVEQEAKRQMGNKKPAHSNLTNVSKVVKDTKPHPPAEKEEDVAENRVSDIDPLWEHQMSTSTAEHHAYNQSNPQFSLKSEPGKWVSRDINELFINGEIHSLESTISESKSSEDNGIVPEKCTTNVNKYHKGKRTSHSNRRKK